MKPKIIILIGLVLLITISSIILNFERSLASTVLTTASYTITLLVFLIIPILIILYVLKNKEKITSNTVKNFLKGTGLLFLGLFVLGITAAVFDQDDENVKFEWVSEVEELDNQYEETNPQQSKSVSLSETKYENMVLNYKGKDGKGFTIEDFANAKCLKDQQGSFAQYMDDNFDDKSGYHSILVHTPVNINLNPPCLGAGWWFGVNNQGNVIAWEYDSGEEILDYLDTQGN